MTFAAYSSNTIRCTPSQSLFAAEQMGAAGDVEEGGVPLGGRRPGGVAGAPAGKLIKQRRIGVFVHEAGLELGSRAPQTVANKATATKHS